MNIDKIRFLNNNVLKILAAIFMVIDHAGILFFPNYEICRIIGRLAYPIFAYMIAEGARYTRNKVKYLATIAALATICQLVYYFAMGSLYQGILVTFSLSVITIYAIDYFLKKKDWLSCLLALATVAAVGFVVLGLPALLPNTDYAVDYKIGGVALPVLIYFAKGKWWKLAAAALGLLLMAITLLPIQWWAFLTLPLLALYNGKRGKYKLKYLFYVFYPVHLVALYFIGMIV
jgi:hypothetical protein